MSFLVVEDNPVQALVLRQAFKDRQFEVDIARDGEEALKLGNLAKYEAILLDWELPNMSGLSLLRYLRTAGVQVPVLMLTSYVDVDRRVEALEAGADDYVCKPFHLEEVLARIRALLRRPSEQVLKLRLADLEMDCVQRAVFRGGTRIHLAKIEYAILEYLMRNAGHAVSRAEVIENIWHNSVGRLDNLVDVYVSHLRRKIDQGRDKELIRTVRGVGYAIVDPGDGATTARA